MCSAGTWKIRMYKQVINFGELMLSTTRVILFKNNWYKENNVE